MSYSKVVFLIIVAAVFCVSAAAFIAFLADKRRAVKGRDRVKEKTLLTLAACFGAPGALLGRIAARHKTEKVYFGIVIWFSLILQAALLVYAAYAAFVY